MPYLLFTSYQIIQPLISLPLRMAKRLLRAQRVSVANQGHTNYQALPTIHRQLPTNTIYRQQTRNSEALTKYRQVLFICKCTKDLKNNK